MHLTPVRHAEDVASEREAAFAAFAGIKISLIAVSPFSL
jgi:hypothetical protein